ncbi:MAG TPA: peptide chain release factor 2 [Patescibacteria group bacterium]|nr:peptide chain release factor 2 [Patescibacteria group bacterium]
MDLKTRLSDLIKAVDLPKKQARISEIEQISASPDFWKDQSSAQTLMKELADLVAEVDEIKSLTTADQATLERELPRLELKKYLSGPYDAANALVAIHSGQGGTEAMDWAAMLKRMYLRYAEKKGWKVQVLEESQGEEAGIKSVTLAISGRYAYGYLRHEKGTHRLVRQSPFNADNLRQTSFALVEVMPEIEAETDVVIKPDDLKIEFYRSSGSGGQNVNKVSTAVRLKHLPTGLVVESQTQRFQEQNRKLALKILKGKLWQIEEEKRLQQLKQIKGEHKAASWGNQIRSYVLHPYKQVKDLRTAFVSQQPTAVLGGELDGFIEAELKL